MPSYQLFVVPDACWPAATGKGAAAAGGVGNSSIPPLFRQLLREAIDLWRRIHKGTNAEVERARYSTCVAEIENWLLRHGEPVTNTAVGASAEVEAAARQGLVVRFPLHPRYFDVMARAHLDRQAARSRLLDVGDNGLMAEAAAGVTASAKVPPAGLGCSIFPPDTLIGHVAECEAVIGGGGAFDEQAKHAMDARLALLRAAVAAGAGVIEVAEELDNDDVLPPVARQAVAVATLLGDAAPGEAQPDPPAADADGARRQPPSKKGREQMADRLAALIEAALPTEDKVNMSNQPHEVSTDVLGRFVRRAADAGADGNGQRIRIVYADGSEARPFPLRCLLPARDAAPASAVTLSAALMSMRHVELDPFVDFAWYRNKEVSQTRPLADSDEFCFQYSQQTLRELRGAYPNTPVKLHLYHTGFEPAAVGFYRALTLALSRGGDRWIRVVPHYFRGGTRFDASAVVWD